jgi:hypothetical protein
VVKLSLEKAGCDFVEICETDGYNCMVKNNWQRLANSISLRSLWCTTGRPNGLLPIWACDKNTDIHPEGAIFFVVPVWR